MPALNDNQLGQVVHERVMLFECGVPSSASLAVAVYEYSESSVADVAPDAELVKAGASA